jgi:hypothetical protein
MCFSEDTAHADKDEFSNATTEDEDVPEDEDEGEEAESEHAEPRPEVPEMEGARMRETRLCYMVQHLMLHMTKIS